MGAPHTKEDHCAPSLLLDPPTVPSATESIEPVTPPKVSNNQHTPNRGGLYYEYSGVAVKRHCKGVGALKRHTLGEEQCEELVAAYIDKLETVIKGIEDAISRNAVSIALLLSSANEVFHMYSHKQAHGGYTTTKYITGVN
eukprot:2980204-Rhodomonas_salina.2